MQIGKGHDYRNFVHENDFMSIIFLTLQLIVLKFKIGSISINNSH